MAGFFDSEIKALKNRANAPEYFRIKIRGLREDSDLYQYHLAEYFSVSTP